MRFPRISEKKGSLELEVKSFEFTGTEMDRTGGMTLENGRIHHFSYNPRVRHRLPTVEQMTAGGGPFLKYPHQGSNHQMVSG